MTATTPVGAVHRVAESLAEVVRHARLSGADELEQAIGLRVDAAGAVILARLRPDTDTRLGDLADRLGLAPSTVSRQLPPLETAGLVARRTDRCSTSPTPAATRPSASPPTRPPASPP
jgi:DNA-binding transcriptional ArsR family regulator